jgi:hypothetical protein
MEEEKNELIIEGLEEKKDEINIEKNENCKNTEKESENKQSTTKSQKTKNKDDSDLIKRGVTLSNTREEITFSESNEVSEDRVTRKSIPFQPDTLDLDIPNFSPPKLNKSNWKSLHNCNYFLFSIFYGISTGFFYTKNSSTYITLQILAHFFLILSTFVEWIYFKRGCIGEANLNTQLKRNIDYSIRARILRSEYGIKYFISFMAAIMLLTGVLIQYFSKQLNLNQYDARIIFIYFNLFGMMSLALSQIMKLNKILNIDNNISYVKNDFSKSLFEVIFFFASLLEGGTYMIQLFHIYIEDSPLYTFHLIFRILDSFLFFICACILSFNYFCSEYCKISSGNYLRI